MASTQTGTNTVVGPTGSTNTGTVAVVTTGSAYTGTSAVTQIDVSKTRDNIGAPLASANYISNTDGTITGLGIDMSKYGGTKQQIVVGKYLFALGNTINAEVADVVLRSSLQVFDIEKKTCITSQYFSGEFFAGSIANNSLVSRIEQLDNADGSVTIYAITNSPITVCKFTVNADGTLKTRDTYKTMVENTTHHSYPITAMAICGSYIAFTCGNSESQKYCFWILNTEAMQTMICRTDLGIFNDMKFSYDFNLYAISDNTLKIFTISGTTLTIRSSINVTTSGACTGIDVGVSANMAIIAVTNNTGKELVFVNGENYSQPFIRNRMGLNARTRVPDLSNTGSIKNIGNVFAIISDTAGTGIIIVNISSISGASIIARHKYGIVSGIADENSIIRKPLCISGNKIFLGSSKIYYWEMYKMLSIFGTTIGVPESIPVGSTFNIVSHDISGNLAGIQYGFKVYAGAYAEEMLPTIYPISSPEDIQKLPITLPEKYPVGLNADLIIKITDASNFSKKFTRTFYMASPVRTAATVSKITTQNVDLIQGAQLDAGATSYIDVHFSANIADVGSKVTLVSDKTTSLTVAKGLTENILRITLPNGLNFNSSYQLVIPTQANGGPSFTDYVPALSANYIVNFSTAKSPSFDVNSTVTLVGLTPDDGTYNTNSRDITVMVDTIAALPSTNCCLSINIKTSDSAMFSQVATADINTNGNATITYGAEYIKSINVNGRYISFILSATDTWNQTTIAAKAVLSKKEDAADKIENTFSIKYNLGKNFTGNPKIGFANGTVWKFTGEDITVPISTPGTIVKNVKPNLILINGVSGAVKGWGSVMNDTEAFQIVLDATKLEYSQAYTLTFSAGSALNATNNIMEELVLSFTTSDAPDLTKPQIYPKLYGFSNTGSKINIEPENNYTEALTAKNKVYLNIHQTNGSDVTEFAYAIGNNAFSAFAAFTLDTDIEIFVSQSCEIRVQCKDSAGNISSEMSCFCKIVSSIQYTVDDPSLIYTISALKVYKPNDLFKYVNGNQYDKDGNENCINDSRMVLECPIKLIDQIKYVFNSTDASLSNATYKSLDTLGIVGEDSTKIVVNYEPTDRANNVRFKIKDKLGNETPVITRMFNYDDEPPKVISANIYDAAANLLENQSTNNPEIVIKVKATDESLPVKVYISEDGGQIVSAPFVLNNGILNILSYTLNDQSNGEKNISIIAVDAAKNTTTNLITKTFSLNKKTIWGSLSIENAAKATNKKMISTTISSNAATKYKLSKTKEELLSGTLEYVPFSSSITITDIDITDSADKSTIKLYALIADDAGNTSVIEDSIYIKRTIVPQKVTIKEGDKVKSRAATIVFETTEDVLYYKLNNNGKWDSTYSLIPDTKEVEFNLTEGDGKKVIGVILKDDFENITGEIKNVITLDTTPPRVNILSKNGYYVTNDVTFDIKIEHVLDDSLDPATGIKFSLNNEEYGANWQPLTNEEDKENIFTIPFTPSDDPTKNSFKINAKVKDSLGNTSTEEMSYVFYYDATPLNVVAGVNNVNVPKSDLLKIVFDKELDSTTVNVNSVKLQKLYTENNNVAYMPFVAANKKVMVINATLEYYTMYKLVITADITDLAGNFLEKEYSITFQTDVDPILTIVSTSIDGEPTDVPADSDFSITFGWPMNFSTTNSSNITLMSDYNGELIPCVIKRGVNNYQVKIIPEEELENGVTFTLSVNDNVKNEKGSSFEPGTTMSYKFKTEYIEPLVIFRNPAKVFIAYKDKKFVKLQETILNQNLVKKHGISIKQLSNIPKDVLQTLEEDTKIIVLANEKYTEAVCHRTIEKVSTVEHVVDSFVPNFIHNNFYWSIMNEETEVDYTKKDKNTIVFAVPKNNAEGNSTINEELKVLCKIKK